MVRKATKKEVDSVSEHSRYGRDELNLLEHSISSAGTQVDRETRSLVFQKTDMDPETKTPVQRTWEVSFSKYGRPTAIDDDVFVALLKVSADLGFTTKRVEFTRYELCKILDWADNGQNYKKIDDALRRITGVYIAATNFWYDNRAKGWRDRNFHVLDSSDVFTRERFDRERRAAGGQTPKSWIQWSDTMMESFAAGYLRKVDLRECLSLDNPVARKLYRYLGMQFYYRTRLCIDLVVLCCEKLGYRKGTEPNELRRKVLPAITQLEGRGIYGLSHEFHSTYGQCEVVFNAKATTKGDAKKRVDKGKKESHPTVARLASFGVDRKDAEQAVATLTSDRIAEDIAHVEYEDRAGRVKTSKAGMLAAMLKSAEPWPRPKGYMSNTVRQKDRMLQGVPSHLRDQEEVRREFERKRRSDVYVASLDDSSRKALEAQAIQESDVSLRAAYERSKKRGGAIAAAALRVLVDDLVQKRLVSQVDRDKG